MYDFDEITKTDPEIADAIKAEMERQNSHIELIASENWVSKAVMAAMGSPLTNKYAEGYPGKRYYGGCQCVDVVEDLARERAKKLFGCEYVNVQPHSGAQANMAVMFAMLEPGDKIMGMNLDHGGHLTHGSPVNMSGKYFDVAHYGVNEDGVIDYDEVLRIAKEHQPKLIVAGASAYARTIDFKRFREIADEVGAYLMVDIAHIAGLVATGLHPSPIPYAHVTTTTTHKTLRGPRGGMIMCSEEMNKKFRNIDSSTDVLSFPLGENGEYDTNPETGAKMLGDIVISVEHALSQANLYGHGIEREVAFLTVHSMLHLLGYDHEKGGLERTIMREKEEQVLDALGLAINKI